MIYPKNFENKLGFEEIRSALKTECLSTLGKDMVDKMEFTSNPDQVNIWMSEIREMRRIIEEETDFPLAFFFDVRESVRRVRLEGTWLEEQELHDMKRSLRTIDDLVKFFYRGDDTENYGSKDSGTIVSDAIVIKKWYFPRSTTWRMASPLSPLWYNR